MKSIIAIVAALAVPLSSQAIRAETSPNRPNVLFIAVDDLRPELGCYGNQIVKSPHIDRLAAASLVFERAYCQQALCRPSRASLLTGHRLETMGEAATRNIRKAMPDVLTLPQHFRNHGYHTISIGKIYHGAQDKPGWSERSPVTRPYYANPQTRAYQKRREAEAKGITNPLQRYLYTVGPPVESADVPDNAYADGAWADEAIRQLQEHRDEPFFLAVGFIKPHLPFCAPKKYWDLYDRDRIPLPNTTLPRGHASEAFRTKKLPFGVVNYVGTPKLNSLEETLSDAWTRKLIHGYHACVSFVDAQVGRLLQTLDDLDLSDNTIAILWGDHGWKLGEYGQWSKQTNFEYDVLSPLMLCVPGKTRGSRTSALVEFVDIYPTLVELCNLNVPAHCEGTSMVPLLDDPDRPWKRAAFSQHSRGKKLMGYSMRTERWRYTEWVDRTTGEILEQELYDQSNGPFVTANLAGKAEYAEVLAQHKKMMKDGWRKAKPRGKGLQAP